MGSRATLPLLAFQHHVGDLYIDPSQLEFGCELGVGDLALVEQGRWYPPDAEPLDVVVKGYKPHIIAVPEDFRELLLEASKLHRLQHPHITQFLGLGCFQCGSLPQVRSSIFMVEEYVGKRCLKKLLSDQMRTRAKNLFSMRAALTWMHQVASALAALHAQQPPYIMGDVKPDNVFLTDGHVNGAVAKLGDLKPHRYIYDKMSSTLSRYLHNTHSTQGPPVRSVPGSAALPEQSSLAKHSAALVSATTTQQQQKQQQRPPTQQSMSPAGRPCSLEAQPAAAAAAAGVCVSESPSHSTAAGDGRHAVGCQPSAAAAAAAAGQQGNAPAPNLSQVAPAKSQPLPIERHGPRKSRTWSAGCSPDQRVSPAQQGPPLFDSAMDSHAHMCELQGKQPAGGHKGAGEEAHLEEFHNSLATSQSLPCDGRRQAAWKCDHQQHQQQQQQHGHDAAGPPPQHFRAVYQEPHDAVSSGGSGKLTASLGRLLKTAGRLLVNDHTRTKRLLYSELAAAAEGSSTSQGTKEPEEGQVRGQQFFSLGSSQDLILAAGSQPTESEADTPCGSGQASHLLLEDGSGHSSNAAAAAAAARASPGSSWLQAVLHAPRTSNGGAGNKRHLSGSLLSSGSEELHAAAGGGMGGASSRQPAASPSDGGWELTATGAANPCGSLQSTLLDLFSDMVDDKEAITWSSQENSTITTICPGTCVQQVWYSSHAAGLPAAAAVGVGAAPATITSSGSSSSTLGEGMLATAGPAAAADANGHPQRSTAAVMPPLLSISFPAASQQRLATPFGAPSRAPFEWAPTAGALEPASEMDGAAVDQATSNATAVARSGVPGIMETKQHGGSSAFLALTAIDSIREESASEWGSSSHGTPPVSAWGSPGAKRHSSSHGEGSIQASADLSGSHKPTAAAAEAAATAGQHKSGSGGGARPLFWTMEKGSSGGGSGSGGLYRNSSPQKPVEPVPAAEHLPCGLAVPAAPEDGTGSCSADIAERTAAMPASARVATSSSGTAPTGSGAGQGGQGDRSARGGIQNRDSSGATGGPSVRGGSKHVRFAVERAAGVTASRDRSLMYTAPEILHGQRPTVKVDVFAFGVMLYELLSRSLIVVTSDAGDYTHHSTGSISSSAWDEGPRALLAYAQRVAGGYRPPMLPHWPTAVVDLITACWATEPSQRPSMEEVASRLAAMAGDRHVLKHLDNFLLALQDIGAGATCQCNFCTIM